MPSSRAACDRLLAAARNASTIKSRSTVSSRTPDFGNPSPLRTSFGPPARIGRCSRVIEAAVAQDRRALDGVAQLADVARPSVGQQRLCASRAMSPRPAADSAADLVQESLGKRQDVVAPLAQRRQPDLERRRAGSRGLRGTPRAPARARGRGWSRRRCARRPDRARAAQPLELALLEHAQQLRLHRRAISPTSSRNSTPPRPPARSARPARSRR